MLKLDRQFLLGKLKGIYEVTCIEENPLQFILKKMMKEELIDGVIGTTQEGTKVKPKLFITPDEIKLSRLSFHSGQNTFLKKAIQKYRLNKIAIVAPSCILDGLNKTQYYGIGCNWAKTAVALKVGILCLGITSEKGLECELLDITGEVKRVVKNYLSPEGYFFETDSEERIKVDMETHHHYINSGCKYCLNLSARGSDITYIPLQDDSSGIFIIRSERGWRTLSILQKKFPEAFKFRLLGFKDISYVEDLLKQKLILNIDYILEKVEMGLPVPKWNSNRFRKFYRLWNSVNDVNIEEEVF